MKLSCGASVGESLELLGFDKGAIEVKDERADHTGSASQAVRTLSIT
jgi:hypothetical protein